MGRDLGYLPGDVGQKLEPWMKPISDTVDFLLDTGGPVRNHTDSTGLLSSGLVEIQPLTYIRGRSIAKRFVVIDEAQNLTPLEVKTVITRIGDDAKVVLTGDPHQIDNPYVDANSNGFTYLSNRFRAQPLAAHVVVDTTLAMWRRKDAKEMLRSSLHTMYPVVLVGLGLAFLAGLRTIPGEDGEDLLMLVFIPFADVDISVGNGFILVGLMLVLSLSLTSLGLLLGTRIKSMEAFQAVMNLLMFPLVFLSPVMFPVEQLPGWLAGR